MGDMPDTPFWKAVRGEIPPPPSAALLGGRVLEAVPGSARVRIEFTATRQLTNVVGAFRCNLRRLVDHANLWACTRELYQQPGIAETLSLDVYKRGHHAIPLVRHPLGILTRGPARPDFEAPTAGIGSGRSAGRVSKGGLRRLHAGFIFGFAGAIISCTVSCDVVRFHPTHHGVPAPLTRLVPEFTDAPIAELRSAIEQRDPQRFTAAYDSMTRACNGCHEAAAFGFNVVARPETNPYSNQRFH